MGRKTVSSLNDGEVEKIVREHHRMEGQRAEKRLEEPMRNVIHIAVLLRASPGDNYRLV